MSNLSPTLQSVCEPLLVRPNQQGFLTVQPDLHVSGFSPYNERHHI